MIITNCPACVNSSGCASHRTTSCDCDAIDACVLKQIAIACQTANKACNGLISADVVLGYLNVT